MDIRKSEHIFHFLEQIHIKYENLSRALSSGEILSNPKKYREFSKELAAIKPLESKYGEFKRLIDQYRETAQLLLSSEKEMVELAGEEREKLGAAIASSEREIEILMVSDAASDDRNVFLEIRAGNDDDKTSIFVEEMM
jgi:peptide chain release factor 1